LHATSVASIFIPVIGGTMNRHVLFDGDPGASLELGESDGNPLENA
jgi:hypothetical protein